MLTCKIYAVALFRGIIYAFLYHTRVNDDDGDDDDSSSNNHNNNDYKNSKKVLF